MGFFNSFSTRIPLAVVGATIYSSITYYIVILLETSPKFAIFFAILVFLFYLGSRLLILFSGIDSPYYSKAREMVLKQSYEINSFYGTTQWVGKFYHYHDIVLFVFLTITVIVFLICLMMDGLGDKPIGNTIQNLWNALFQMP